MKSGARSKLFLSLLSGLILAVLAWFPGLARFPGTNVAVVRSQSTGQPKKVYLPVIANGSASSSSPLVSTSLYMYTKDRTQLVNEGCALGQRDLGLPGKQDSVVVLAFGYPQRSAGGVYGTRGYGYPPNPWTIAEITAAVENFGYAYWNCVNSDFDSHLRIAIGTNNFKGDTNSAVNAGHGIAWANMISAVNDWFVNNCPNKCDGQVDAVGANDIELSWNTPAATIDWLNGYTSVTKYPLYNFGAIEGCPWLAHSTYTCLWGNLEQVWFVVWGSPPVQPLPEIYLTNGINAEQWYLMSVYSYQKHGEKMQFIGPMTETQACQQEGGCPKIDNPPENAWWQLYRLLNGDPRTAGEMLPFLTDIKWLGRY
jgi:hypothetical protein